MTEDAGGETERRRIDARERELWRERVLASLAWAVAVVFVGMWIWAVVRGALDLGARVAFAICGLLLIAHVVQRLRLGQGRLAEASVSLEQLTRAAAHARERAEQVQREAGYRKAAELDLVARLSGSMAHDFNNALLVIFAAVDRLGRADVPPELDAAVGAIRSAANQAAAAARQLRAFGAHTSHAVTFLVLAPTVRRLSALLARVLPSNIELALDVDDEVAISADEAQIQRLLTGLVLSSRDALRDGGRVTLRVKRAALDGAACALMEVEDDGPSRSEDALQRLFEPPFTAKGGVSTGLGLSSVRQRVEAAGGRVSARRRPGAGSTLSVYWPLAEAEAVAARPSAPALNGAGINVLVIDDDSQVRSLLTRGLRRLGFSVLEAGDGREGLALARRQHEPVHALCTDCVMPGMPLPELVAAFRASHPRASVVVCSGHTPEQVGLEPGTADRFLAKPFQVKDLASCICELRRRASGATAPGAALSAGAA